MKEKLQSSFFFPSQNKLSVRQGIKNTKTSRAEFLSQDKNKQHIILPYNDPYHRVKPKIEEKHIQRFL